MSQSPPSLTSEYAESTNPTTIARVQMSMAKTAQDISSEPTDTPNHTQRNQLASQVARAPQMMAPAFTTMVCAQGITSASSDADIANMVSAVWNTMAGVA
jgi:hypothetical protein